MKTIRIRDREERESTIVCRKNVFSAVLAPLGAQLPEGGGMLFTDANVYALYRAQIERSLGGVPCFVMPAGEANKNENTLFSLLKEMRKAELRRNSLLIALGGGVVGDLGGLAASLYMRGISCMQVPTTLLAQVDSSVGGKTAVDFCGVKNLIGAFSPAARVEVDPAFLQTLPRRELRCGLGEIVKHGALSAPLFEKLLSAPDLFDLSFLAQIVPENIAFKASVVRRDPHERDLRKCLNLGHTTAHALELGGCGLSHGECVLWGLILESRLAVRHCGGDKKFAERLSALCFSALEGGTLPPLDVENARLDKKNASSDRVTLAVPVAPERYELLELPFAQYAKELSEVAKEC